MSSAGELTPDVKSDLVGDSITGDDSSMNARHNTDTHGEQRCANEAELKQTNFENEDDCGEAGPQTAVESGSHDGEIEKIEGPVITENGEKTERSLTDEEDGAEKTDEESECETQEDNSDTDDVAATAEELFKTLSAENRITHRVINDDELPTTVSVLEGQKGSKVYLIGTAHFSKESCEDVRNVITQAQPDVVMIELCRGRTDLLVNDEETLAKLAGDLTFDKIVKQIRHKGLVSGLMTFLLLHMSAHITKQLGMAPGGEFRAAFQEYRRVPGCKLLFGDRAVEVTLQRAFSTFSIWQKMKFAFCILKDLGPIKPEDIEKLKEKDMLEQALGEMMGEFPEMTSVFLAERDIYLAHSLQIAASNEIRTENDVSPTVVVGVVGLGHVAGIKENFSREITMTEMKELVKVPQPSKIRTALKMIVKLSFLVGLGYGSYRFMYWTGLFQGIQSISAWSGLGGYLPFWGRSNATDRVAI